MLKKINVVLVTGGTGGHIIPALALSDAILDKGSKVCVFMDKRGKNLSLGWNEKVKIRRIYARGFKNKKILNKIFALFLLGVGFMQSLINFLVDRPSIVVGFGGYVSLAPIIVARVLGIKTIIHEQNSCAGNANKLLARFVDKIYTSFPKTEGFKSIYKNKMVCIGMPIRKTEILRASSLGTNAVEKKKIFILGGSLGAAFFDRSFVAIFEKLPEKIKNDLIVYHQSRTEVIEEVQDAWGVMRIDAVVKPFFSNVIDIMARSDLVITRSGSSTIFEVCALGKVALYVPLPNAVDNHQYKNAKYIYQNKACFLLEQEEEGFKTNLLNIISSLFSNHSKFSKIGKQAFALSNIDSADNFAQNIFTLCDGKEDVNKKI